ncbi:hypothetical protein LJB42_001798 [Komagataella kurtzmanii]|nr:hypothetical protein LJB42_001798 [Komagataella kurtzmanii]
MSTYAEAATPPEGVSAGKPKPVPEVEQTQDPHGSVQVVDEIADDAEKVVKDASDEFKKSHPKTEKDLQQLLGKIKTTLVDFAATVKEAASSAAVRSQEELKNPVVSSHVVAAGVGAAVVVASKTGKINNVFSLDQFTKNQRVGVIAGVIATVLIVDGLLTSKYYPKYKKN